MSVPELDPFDPKNLQIPDSEIPCVRLVIPGITDRRQYIPSLPLATFNKLVRLPGKALAVYLLIWRRAKVKKSRTFKVTSALLQRHEITRSMKSAALRHLEQAGLITVVVRVRRNPEVTLV